MLIMFQVLRCLLEIKVSELLDGILNLFVVLVISDSHVDSFDSAEAPASATEPLE